MKGIAYMYEYIQLGRPEVEWTYNLAHLYHNLSIYHLAVPLYEKCLKSLNCAKKMNGGEDPEENVAIRFSVAQNLSLILRASGNLDAARSVLFANVVW